MNRSVLHSPRFWIPALAAAAGIGLTAYVLGRGPEPGDRPRDVLAPEADGIPPLPPGLPPPGPEAEAAAAIDALLARAGRHLAEEEFELAAEVFGRAMEDSREAGDHERRVRSALGRTEALARMGREPEALELAATTRKERSADPPSAEVLRLAALESALLLAAGRPLEAAPVAREALDEADRYHAGDAILRGLLVAALADALVAAEGFAGAARLLDDHLARVEVRAALPPAARADWLDRTGRLHGAAGNFAISVERLESSLDERAGAGGDDPLPAAVTRVSLAASLFDAGQPERARTEAGKAHAVLAEKLPPDDPERRRLADIAARIGAALPEP